MTQKTKQPSDESDAKPPSKIPADNLISAPPTEAASERNGLFSYAGEWHAFILGLGVGFATVVPIKRLKQFAYRAAGVDPDAPRRTWLHPKAWEEVASESWYAIGGMFVGVALGISPYIAGIAGYSVSGGDFDVILRLLRLIMGM